MTAWPRGPWNPSRRSSVRHHLFPTFAHFQARRDFCLPDCLRGRLHGLDSHNTTAGNRLTISESGATKIVHPSSNFASQPNADLASCQTSGDSGIILCIQGISQSDWSNLSSIRFKPRQANFCSPCSQRRRMCCPHWVWFGLKDVTQPFPSLAIFSKGGTDLPCGLTPATAKLPLVLLTR